MDYIIGTRMFALKRKKEVEDRRVYLTCKLKNMILFHLSKIKAAKSQASFKEVISNLINEKKAAMQKERKIKMLPGGNLGDQFEVKDGLTKAQANTLINELDSMMEYYTDNNDKLRFVGKQLTLLLAKKGIQFKSTEKTPREE